MELVSKRNPIIMYGGGGSKAPHILNFGNRWRQVVNKQTNAVLRYGKNSLYI